MSSTTTLTTMLAAVALAICLSACDEPQSAPAAASASSAPAATSAPPTKASAPRASAAAASAPAKVPSHPCPDGAEGDGTLKAPCEAKGATRIMEVTWNGKMDDKGPSFKVTNKAKLEILYGKIIVYFYDKDGKQLEVAAKEGGKPRPRLSCAGNIFAGPMKAGETAVLTFSCVKKTDVPEGATAIEAELQTVGFTGKDGKRADTFWRNNDLVPAERPKGGVK